MSKLVLGPLFYLITVGSGIVVSNLFVSPQVVLPELSFWVWSEKERDLGRKGERKGNEPSMWPGVMV